MVVSSWFNEKCTLGIKGLGERMLFTCMTTGDPGASVYTSLFCFVFSVFFFVDVVVPALFVFARVEAGC